MNNRDYISAIITQFSGQNNIIPIPTIYIKITEDYHTAALLNQLIYWSDRTHRKDGYFYKSYKEWEEEIFLSKYQVMRAVKKLKGMGIVETALKKANGAPTVHYKIDSKVVSQWIVKFLHNGKLNNSTKDSEETQQSLTETTTEITTERRDTRARESPKFDNTNNSNSEHNGKYQEIVDMYEKNFGIINGIDYENINHWLSDFEEKGSREAIEIMLYAMTIATENNAGSFKYVEKVLNNWWQRNLITLEDVKRANKQPRKKKTRSNEKENWDNINLDEIENSKDKNDDMWDQFLDL
ncbi:DnaD domain-containing protein [Staphylococcus simulans]|uniref:DnaD domain-containing protein n=1 Tax=Staphylococcus simulans TaxID=1286 RepID=UPI003CEC1823